MSPAPTGKVTFLFTDIEGSTQLLQHLEDRYMDVLGEHRRLLRAGFQEAGGYEVDTSGDGFFLAFAEAADALRAAMAGQRAIAAHPWPEGAPIRVRMGIHTGEATPALEGYVGLDVHRAARIMAAGYGGQILLSQATETLIEGELPEGVTLRDLGEHRLKDLSRPEHIFQVVTTDLPVDFPPLRTLDIISNNLPIQLTSFIGREHEIKEVKRLLTATRLLTLQGAGGAGKTRLAIQVAADLVEEFRNGVWLVDLAPLADPALVVQTVASTLGVREVAGRTLLDTMADSLRPKTLLLVLDNCEHLVSACAHLAEGLLHTCPSLRILATSREALRIAGETAYRVPSLSLPSAPLPLERIAQYEAVRLFIDRAAAALHGFTVTPRSLQAVASICLQLDGMPLAIELAAAQIKALSVEQIAGRLRDRFQLLTRGSRTALPRHQTLQAAMEWSYDLLSEEERLLLRRLSVFAGGWTLEAAEVVCAGDGADASVVIGLLIQLVEKSLVMVNGQAGEARYRLLETVRQFSGDKLKETGETGEVRRRHLDFFLALAEEAQAHQTGIAHEKWLNRMDLEHDNLRLSLEWSTTAGDADTQLRLATAIGPFWQARGYLGEGRAWLEGALARALAASPSVRAQALNQTGILAWRHADYERAAALCEESLALHRKLGNRKGSARVLHDLAHLAEFQGDYRRAESLFEESVALYRELGERWGLAQALNCMGRATLDQEDYGRALALLEESLALAQAVEDKAGMGWALGNLGDVAQLQGNYTRARALLEQSLELHREAGLKGGIASSLLMLGNVVRHLGDYVNAAALLREALSIYKEMGQRRSVAISLETMAAVAGAQGHSNRAARLFGAAEALREAISAPLPMSERADHQRSIAALRAAMGEEAFVAGRAAGGAMTPEQAIEFALSDHP